MNNYRDKEWLVEHYITRNLSVCECARISSVSAGTINYWLRKHSLVGKRNLNKTKNRDGAVKIRGIGHRISPHVVRQPVQAAPVGMFYDLYEECYLKEARAMLSGEKRRANKCVHLIGDEYCPGEDKE